MLCLIVGLVYLGRQEYEKTLINIFFEVIFNCKLYAGSLDSA